MKFHCLFHGREALAIGITHATEAVVEADNVDAARLKLYERFEHISRLDIKPAPQTTLHLSVINDGSTYAERMAIVKRETSEEYKLRAFEQICAKQAMLENRTQDASHTSINIKSAALDVFDHMMRHIQEMNSCPTCPHGKGFKCPTCWPKAKP